MTSTQYSENDLRYHTTQVKGRLQEVISSLPGAIEKVDDPAAKAIFEMTREVLNSVVTTYDHLETRSEPAFR